MGSQFNFKQLLKKAVKEAAPESVSTAHGAKEKFNFKHLLYRLCGIYPMFGPRPFTEADYAEIWKGPEYSMADLLNFVDYDDKEGIFLLNDGINVGAYFELTPYIFEGRSQETLAAVHRSVVGALHSFPEDEEAPWIVQIFANDEPIRGFVEKLEQYAHPDVRATPIAQRWFTELKDHLEVVSRPEGYFIDQFNGTVWGGVERKIRVIVYRYAPAKYWLDENKALLPNKKPPHHELNQVVKNFARQLEQANLKLVRRDGESFYNWLAPWFSPKPRGCNDGFDFITQKPYPPKRASTYDFGQAVFSEEPVAKDGEFWFCDQPTRFITLGPLEAEPPVGFFTVERDPLKAGKPTVVWDLLPRGCMASFTVVVESQFAVKRHLFGLISAAGNASDEAEQTANEARNAISLMAQGEKLYRFFPGIYVRGRTKTELDDRVLSVLSLLRSRGLSPIDPKWDLKPLDSFIRALPFGFSNKHDRKHGKRAWLCNTELLVRLLPIFGRDRGTGNPGLMAFNRSGEILTCDPFSKKDRMKTAHALIFGPTGAGKSATVNYFIQMITATKKMRWFLLEKGNSFGPLAEHFEHHGKTVNHIRFTSTDLDISLPPYAETAKAVHQLLDVEAADLRLNARMNVTSDAAALDPTTAFVEMAVGALDAIEKKADEAKRKGEALLQEEEDDDEDAQRDYFGEMLSSTLLMISGANKDEERAITRAQRAQISKCLVLALKQAHQQNRIARPSDVVAVMEERVKNDASLRDDQREALNNHACALSEWTVSTRGWFFNRDGVAFPEKDLTVIDFGILAADNNKDMLALATIQVLNVITGIGEKYQYSDQAMSTTVVTDEGHMFTKNPVIVAPFVFGVKTWRKLDIWLWQTTQNVKHDYPGEAQAMLNLAEWWICLCMPPAEVVTISEYRTLTPEQEALLRSARKGAPQYTEGVIMCDKFTSLFRIVMPPLPLELARTDPDEKKALARFAKEHNTDALGARYLSAEIAKKRRREEPVE